MLNRVTFDVEIGHATYLALLRLPDAEVNIVPLMNKDSLEMTDADLVMRDMGTHLCALPTGEHCPRGLVCLGCSRTAEKERSPYLPENALQSRTRTGFGKEPERTFGPDRGAGNGGRSHQYSLTTRRRTRQ